MFHNPHISTTLSADRRTRLRTAAARHRLVRPDRVPPVDVPTASVLSIVSRDDPDLPVSLQRVHCVA